ncbi:branched-chain-amino-acid aminotransferase-like protein 1 [Gigaspora margarita]|uniref:Branched-chain-amino-acid aminotransferase-like protein 1 n=1 Tax=Gigaspora margarita TaxID=4874 RepID=A0A8H4A947_GIGMA|nr:branched-chain-amino-acid aminotransferase-like protein 1 [Gigaspora margarita]
MGDQRPIILWAHPRSLSTVFERPFLQCPQEFHVIHEPFVPIRLAYKTKNFKFLNKIPLPKPTDPITFVHHFSPILNEFLAPHYYNEDKTHTLRVFVKDHATDFLYALEGNPLRSKETLSKFQHTFLIRNPEKSIKSYYKAANSTYNDWNKADVPNLERIDLFSSNKIGLEEPRILYDLIKDITGENIALVDADDLVREPEKVLRKYCEMINVKFKKEMLEWKAEKVEIWDNKKISSLNHLPDFNYNLWHKNAMQSTRFEKLINNDEEIEYPQIVYELIAKSKPHYEYLFQHRIKI